MSSKKMSLFRISLVVVLTAILVAFLPRLFQIPRPIRIEGFVAPGFENVNETLHQLFLEGFERVGASFAAYYKGELVVDLRGGYADESILRPWTEDTWSVMWSSTKAITALALAWVVDRGYVSYDTLVVDFWPEFARHGKSNVTLEWLANHKSGVITTNAPLFMDTMRDWKKLGQLIADTKPFWPPGEHSGYTPLIYGNIIDQVIRRVDPQKRSLSQLVQDEFVKPHNLDFSIGCPYDQFYRLTRATGATPTEIVYSLINEPESRIMFFNILWSRLQTGIFGKKSLFRHSIEPMFGMLDPDISMGPNIPEWINLDMGAAHGVGTAKSIAKMFSLLGDDKLISNSMVAKISTPTWFKPDVVLQLNLTRGYGFFHYRSPLGDWQLGHPGYGGQNLWLDPKHRLSFAYLTNAYKLGLGHGTPTFQRLQNALYQSIKYKLNQ